MILVVIDYYKPYHFCHIVEYCSAMYAVEGIGNNCTKYKKSKKKNYKYKSTPYVIIIKCACATQGRVKVERVT